jgi:hypothetical protein
MDIKEVQRCLGEVDVQALREAILAQEPEAWTEQLIRQPASWYISPSGQDSSQNSNTIDSVS